MTEEYVAVKCPITKMHKNSTELLSYIKNKLNLKTDGEKMQRVFHREPIGLVKAQFCVGELDEKMKVGLFAEPITYPAYIRFTNSASSVKPDINKMIRGMAIKVFDEKGKELQDFILSTSPIFFSGQPDVQLAGVKLILGNFLEKISAVTKVLFKCLRGALAFLKTNSSTPNVLEEIYYSGTPYGFGDEVVKWQARPNKTMTSILPKHPTNNFLRKRLADDLSQNAQEDISFSFCVQFQQDAATEPVEDPSVIWRTEATTVATIIIPKQEINTDSRKKLEQTMSFSPGCCLKAHQPLGELNRIRAEVYEELAKDRERQTLALNQTVTV